MSFYRTFIAAVAAIAISTQVFDAETNNDAANNPANSTTQSLADNSASTDTSATTTPSDQQTMSSAEQTKININKATAKDLMKIKGLNAAKARSIVAYRKKHGDFKSIDDLSNVKGFKKMKTDNLKEIQDQLSID